MSRVGNMSTNKSENSICQTNAKVLESVIPFRRALKYLVDENGDGRRHGGNRTHDNLRRTHQSVETHVSTASKPLLTLCTVSWGTSGLSRKPITCLMTLASRRIRPITTHHSRQPASMNTCSRYLKGAERSSGQGRPLVSHESKAVGWWT